MTKSVRQPRPSAGGPDDVVDGGALEALGVAGVQVADLVFEKKVELVGGRVLLSHLGLLLNAEGGNSLKRAKTLYQ